MDLDKVNGFFERFARGVLRHRLLVIIAVLAVVGFFASQLPKMHFITSFESFFVEDDEEIVRYNAFKEEFGNDKTVFVLVEPRQGGLFTLENMGILKKITEDLEKHVPYLDEVTSVTNAEFIEGQDNTLKVYDLMEDFPVTQHELDTLKEKILAREIYRDSIVSKDGEKAGILIKLLLAEDDPDYEEKVAKAVRAVFDKEAYQKLEFYEVGAVLFDTEFQGNVKKETMKFFRLSVILIMVLLFLFIRRFYGVYVPL
ncbi:MAG: MMPL family transporter, partial [Desulfobacteraceae bacterium]